MFSRDSNTASQFTTGPQTANMNLDSGAEMPNLMVSTLQLMQRDLSEIPQESVSQWKCKCESCRCARPSDNADNSHFGSPFVVVESKLVLGIPTVIAGLLLEQ